MADKVLYVHGHPIKTVDGGDDTELLAVATKRTSTAPEVDLVSVDTTEDGAVIAAANANRQSVTLQNVGTEPCLVRLGGDPADDAYHFVLAKDSAARAGDGGSVTIDNYTGAIKGITEANSTVIAVTEVV